MLQVDSYVQFLLNNIPTARVVSGNTEILCRCFDCPDSNNPNHAHFYISIPRDDQPSVYHCKKCNSSGIVTSQKLLDWGIYDDSLAISLNLHNKKSARLYPHRRTLNIRPLNPINKLTDNNLIKLNYLNNRLGLSLSLYDLIGLKIILNLDDFILYNNLSISRSEFIIKQLSDYFLGFLAVDNSYLNLRKLTNKDLHNSINKRYINYNIFGKEMDDASKYNFYTIPCGVNVNTVNRIKLHVAEGPFDILSIYFNVMNRESGIYTSINGGNYIRTIEYFLLQLKTPNIELHIYPDNDEVGSDYKMRQIYNYLYYLNIPMYIHRNIYEDEKDYGVTREKIKDYVYMYK